MISRYFVIGLAFVTAGLTARRHDWAQTAGLLALGIGLTLVRLADTRQLPVLKKVAWACFAVTLIVAGVVLQRNFLR